MKSKLLLGLGVLAISANALAAQTKTTTTESTLNKMYLRAGIGVMKYTTKFKDSHDQLAVAYVGKVAPKTAPVYNVGVGYKFTDSLRSDITFSYIPTSYKSSEKQLENETTTAKQKITTLSLMLNGYYDFNINETLVPYLTVGVGAARHNIGDLTQSSNAPFSNPDVFKGGKKNAFAWNVGGGVKFNLNKNYAIDLGYKFVDFGKISVSRTNTLHPMKCDAQKVRGHQAVASFIYSF